MATIIKPTEEDLTTIDALIAEERQKEMEKSRNKKREFREEKKESENKIKKGVFIILLDQLADEIGEGNIDNYDVQRDKKNDFLDALIDKFLPKIKKEMIDAGYLGRKQCYLYFSKKYFDERAHKGLFFKPAKEIANAMISRMIRNHPEFAGISTRIFDETGTIYERSYDHLDELRMSLRW